MPIVTNEFVNSAIEGRAYQRAMLRGIIDLKMYLTSEKFTFPEAWVNPSDVLLRLQEIERAAADEVDAARFS